jgi:1,4-alpha-glucan branching enzyme
MRPPPDELDAIAALAHGDPHNYLGRHLEDGRLVFRAFRRGALEVRVRRDEATLPMLQVHPAGIFEATTDESDLPAPDSYRIEVAGGDSTLDPYAFSPTIGPLDLHLIGEGKHEELYRVLGAFEKNHQGARGTAFTVWAPAAKRISVVGDFNGWDGSRHLMRRLGKSIWELFIPEIGHGALYKFEVQSHTDDVCMKTDPFARAIELRPSTASRVYTSRHAWGDEAWVAARARTAENPLAALRRPMAIYEVHLGSWRHHPGPPQHEDRPNWLSYRELADQLVDYVIDMGFTHVELLPVMEHPFDGSWGYQVGGYYAPTSRYGSPDDLRYFVDRCHQRGIGVLVDWVPAHFPKDSFALGRFDGTALYEHIDPRQGEHRQWGTYMFNYGRNEVRNFLVANALYWIDELHVDGLRADAVASMLYLDYGATSPSQWKPNRYGGRENLEAVELMRELCDAVHARFPGALVIAEESTAWPGVTHPTRAGGLGFDLKWNMGWMHDTLDYFAMDSVFRSFHHHRLTFGLMYAYSERFVLPLSHDEVVHMKGSLLGKMAGDPWRKFANLRALLAHMWSHPGKKLLFMGGEIGQWREWSEERELDWHLLEDGSDDNRHAGLQRLVRDLNRHYRDLPALYQADHEPRGFRWIDCTDNRQSVISYLRFPIPPENELVDEEREAAEPPKDYVVCVANLTPLPRVGYRIGVPAAVRHQEILNTDAAVYGGSGMGNLGAADATPVEAHGFAQSLSLTLPPLAVLWLRPEALSTAAAKLG